MRAARRTPNRNPRKGLPAQSRVTVRRAVAALRRGRLAVAGIESQLDELLRALQAPELDIDPHSPDRLADSARGAQEALAVLDELRALF